VGGSGVWGRVSLNKYYAEKMAKNNLFRRYILKLFKLDEINNA
jgi:hypothetical protein